MKLSWETLEERVKRHYRIPLKKKMEWLGRMLQFANGHQLQLRRKLRARVR